LGSFASFDAPMSALVALVRGTERIRRSVSGRRASQSATAMTPGSSPGFLRTPVTETPNGFKRSAMARPMAP
jgi:hypothetical protein